MTIKFADKSENKRSFSVIYGSSSLPKDIIKKIENLGLKFRGLPPFKNLDDPVCDHPDMICNKIHNSILINKLYYNNNFDLFKDVNCILTDEYISKEYPYDILFNALNIGNYLICNKKYTSKLLLNEYNVINCKQGYTRCSTLVVDDQSIITADKSINNIALKLGISSLLIESGHIDIKKYDYGFIGGCYFNYNKTIYFTGDINKHPNSNRIIEFIKNRNYNIEILSNNKLFDYGGFVIL